MAKTMICQFCAAEFEEDLVKCPYCGSTNIVAAEAEYMKKLEDIREDVEEIREIPKAEVHKVVKKQKGIFKLSLIIVSIYLAIMLVVSLCRWAFAIYNGRQELHEMVQRREIYEQLDQLFDEGKYEEVYELYNSAFNQVNKLYRWERSQLMEQFDKIELLEEGMAIKEEEGLSDYEYEKFYKYYVSLVLYTQSSRFSVEEQEIVKTHMKDCAVYWESYFQIPSEDMETMQKAAEESWNGECPYDVMREYAGNAAQKIVNVEG